jgi:hypothetical protein
VVATLRPHTDAVITALEGAGLVVGLAAKPDGAGSKWAVIHPFGQDEATSIADPHAGMLYTVQVMSFGLGPEQAEWVADRARAALLVSLAIEGRTWIGVQHEPSPPLARDDDVSPPVFYLSETFRIRTSPA